MQTIDYRYPNAKQWLSSRLKRGKNMIWNTLQIWSILGVVIAYSLNFELHMNEKINKANQTMGMIRRAFTFLDEDMFVCLFKAFVRPQLEYAYREWNPYKAKDINAVENVQRRATKLIPSLNAMTYTERLQKLKLPTLVYRRTRSDMIETYTILNNYNEYITPVIKSNKSALRITFGKK